MTDILEVSSEWLALREPEDARSRSRELAAAAARVLPGGPLVVHDLGSGTGSMMRWLAPRLPGPQSWVLHDWNAHLVERAVAESRPSDAAGHPVRAEGRASDVAELSAAELSGASLVTASALLDVLTSAEIHTIAAACIEAGVPVLFALSVTGRVALSPRDGLDGTIETAFNAHQLRDAGGRRQLGRFGAPIAQGLFKEAGWHVRPATTVWRLDRRQPRLLAEWLDGWIDAAVDQEPALAAEAGRYRRRRARQLERGGLSARIEHVDLLAWPRR